MMKGNRSLTAAIVLLLISSSIAGCISLVPAREMMESFGGLGFTADEQRSVLRICAAVLHLGNVAFSAVQLEQQDDGSKVRL